MASYIMDLLSTLTNCIACFPGSPNLKINSKTYKMLRLLGEGGFSYVYLVEETSSAQLYALKKIRCPFGEESVALALRECEAYTLFAPDENIIGSIDYQVVDAGDKSDPGAKTVYIVLPYYRRGNLQDAINANLVERTRFPEKRLLALFLGIARGLKRMHQFRGRRGVGGREGERGRVQGRRRDGAEGGGDGDDEAGERLMGDENIDGMREGEIRAYAHRDIKPGNIMIANDGTTPIVMDLGSLSPSPQVITSRSLALSVQDTAAEHSTMPYRAPELFDVKTGSIIDTKVDIWSLGCTLYACLVGKSPFEARSEETGGSLSICVLGGDWRFPDEKVSSRTSAGTGTGIGTGTGAGAVQGSNSAQANGKPLNAGTGGNRGEEEEYVISQPVKDIVRRCLSVEPADRPDVDELIQLIEDVIPGLEDF